MAYQALARKWRPQSFRDIIGQQTAVRTLQNAIEQKRIHHAYLFSGVRGVGKTTTARILAKALNCERGPAPEPCNECSICREITEGIDMDVREIDAATYSKAEDVREIREVIQFQPARDRYRIFIIDEVHSLSGQAWNALLKQIEEPPPHVIFMMATTEMQKVPATILSRVQQFALRKITHEELRARLAEICEAEGIDADQEALDVVVRRGEGSVRDSLSLLDQIVAFSGRSFRAPDIAAILGSSDASLFGPLMLAVESGEPPRVLELLEDAAEKGRDFKLLYRDLLGYLRNLLLIAGGAPERMVSVSPGDLAPLRDVASHFDYAELLRILNLLIRDDELVSRTEQQRLAVEIALLRAATLPRLRKVEDVLAGSGGTPPARPRPAAATAIAPAPATPRRATPPAAPATPAPAATPGPSSEFRERLVAHIAKQRRAAATYLDTARSISLDRDALVIEFDAANRFAADYLSEQSAFIAAAAEELEGRPVRVSVRTAEEAPKAAPATPTVQDDPVLRSFQKHLGGEVVSRGSRRTNQEE